MSTTTITRKEIAVPADLIVEVAAILEEHEMTAHVLGSDEEEDAVTLEVEYSREERTAILQIENLIADHEEGGEDDEDGEDDEEESNG